LTKDLVRWKRYMEEESDARIRYFFTNHARHQAKLVIVNPNGISRFNNAEQVISKDPVGLFVFFKRVRIVDHVRWKAMEKRPDCGIRKSIVVLIIDLLVDKKRLDLKVSVVFLKLLPPF